MVKRSEAKLKAARDKVRKTMFRRWEETDEQFENKVNRREYELWANSNKDISSDYTTPVNRNSWVIVESQARLRESMLRLHNEIMEDLNKRVANR